MKLSFEKILHYFKAKTINNNPFAKGLLLIVLALAFLVCFGCSQEPSEKTPDLKSDTLDMTPDMSEQDIIIEDMKKDTEEDTLLDASHDLDLDDMDKPDLLAPGRPCEMDSQCIRGAVCDRDKCSVIAGCAESFDDPPPTLAGKGCLITGFSKSQFVAFECDSDETCDEGKPCIMNACQDGSRCNESSSCPFMKVCYAEVCVEPRQ
tara:strand:+ start:1035 stop:1652 length:618 start_codon:yes stop_codon:yes gene_type:complete